MTALETVCAIELRGITKRFGEVAANDGIDLTLNRGEILSLLGENGSGKTTLMNMLSGIYFPDEGEILVNGSPVSIRSPRDAFAYGMSFARIYIYSGPVMGILFVFINAIQSTGAALPALILSISRQGIIYLPVLFLFRNLFDSAKMLAAAQPITDYLSTALAVALFLFNCRKYFSKIQEQEETQTSTEIRPNASRCSG